VTFDADGLSFGGGEPETDGAVGGGGRYEVPGGGVLDWREGLLEVGKGSCGEERGVS
jgi:hypothetical protein